MRLSAAVVALLAVAAVVVAVPHAAAQAPPSPAPAVSVAITNDTGKVSVDEPATFDVVVRNEGAASNTPMDQQNQATVTVAVSGMPEGWTASVDPASFRLPPQGEQRVRLQVAVAADASDSEATLTVTATLTSPLGGLDPILGPGGASQTATATDAIEVRRDDSVTRDVLEAVGPWIYAILLVLVAAVLVAVAFSLAGRRPRVRMLAEGRELTVPPGGRVVFPFRVEALGKEDDTVLLQVSAVQEGWAAFLPVPELTLSPGQVHDLNLVVIAPKGAPDGARQAVLVSASSARSPRSPADLEFVAEVRSGTPLPPTPPSSAPRRK